VEAPGSTQNGILVKNKVSTRENVSVLARSLWSTFIADEITSIV
jgi:hypothetical protein